MFGIVANIRGLVQGVVSGAVRAGISAAETFSGLVGAGVEYARSQFDIDFASYSKQSVVVDGIYDLPPDQLIPGSFHVSRSAATKQRDKFAYTLQANFMDAKGKVTEVTRGVFGDQRLTFDEIMEEAESWPEDYDKEGLQRATEWEIVEAWVRD